MSTSIMWNHLIAEATADRGVPIDRAHLSLVEECFQTSFRHVRLHATPASHAANRALGSLAFTVGSHICFRDDLLNQAAPSSPSFVYLLAHELAHVAQKIRGSRQRSSAWRQPSDNDLESEACVAAIAALRGKRAPSITPDHSSAPRLYGPAGHYYTSFWACLAAGFELPMALRIAFYTQMPDQVKELDATAAGISMAASALKVVAGSVPGNPDDDDTAAAQAAATAQANQNIKVQVVVQEGLHSLTGKNAENETTFRSKQLKDALASQACGEAAMLRIGLAVHAFGDSFAHRDLRNGQFMYSPVAGHAVEKLGPNDPHSPDNINFRKDLYCRYGRELYKLLADASGATPPVSPVDFGIQLMTVAMAVEEETQADRIVDNIGQILKSGPGTNIVTLGGFDPLAEKRGFTQVGPLELPPPWIEFKEYFIDFNLPPDTLQNSLQIAAEWAHVGLPLDVAVQQAIQAARNVADSASTYVQKKIDAFDQAVDNDIYNIAQSAQPYTGDNLGM